MFSKIALFAVAIMAVFVFVAAAPTPDGGGIQNSCNSGPVQCCNQLMDSDSKQANFLTALVGLVASPISGQVGVQCSPITVIGQAPGACSSQTVCCSDNKFKGLVAVGCSPINL